jgi:superfamily I DNA/RNA helicase
MQSIYRFREAEVGLFLRARREGLGGVALEPLTLTTNFRSQSGLVSWFNAVFPRVLPAVEEETSGAVPYSPSTSHHAALPGAAAAWHGFFDRDGEARKVVQLVKEATGKVAILVRNRSHLDRIVPALKAEGIRYRAVDIDALGEKQIVQDLYALTRALTHPADRVARRPCARRGGCRLLIFQGILRTKTETSGNGPTGSRTGRLRRPGPLAREPAARHAARPRRRRLARARRPGLRRRRHRP